MILTVRPTGLTLTTLVALIGIVLLLVLIYLPAIHGPFVLDDQYNVAQTNKPLESIADLKAIALSNSSGPLGRPIPVVSFALNYHFFGPESTSFKAVNLLIHAAGTVVVFFFIRYLLLITSATTTSSRALDPNRIALAMCSLWAIHPLQVSTVMYVVQRMTLLMTLFTLLSMLLYMIARRRYLVNKPGAGIALIGASASAVLACFSKENGALLLLYVLLLELCIFQFRLSSIKLTKAFKYTCLVTTFVGCSVIAAYVMLTPEYLAAGYQLREFTLPERLITQLVVVAHYLSVFYIPDVSNMSLYQDSFPISRNFGMKETLSAIFLATLALTAWLMRMRHPVYSFGILFFFASHAMESTVLPLELAFEHRTYIGTIGLALSLVYLIGKFLQGIGTSILGYIVFPALAVVLAIQTSVRVFDWQDDMTLATASVVKKPDSLRANISLATGLIDAQKPADAITILDNYTAGQPAIALPQLMAFYIQTLHGVNDPQRVERIYQQLRSSSVSRDTVASLRNLSELFEQLPENHPARDQILGFHDIVSNNDELRVLPNEQAAMLARHASLQKHLNQNELVIHSLLRATSLNSKNYEIRLRLAEALAITSNWPQLKEQLEILENTLNGVDMEQISQDSQNRLDDLKRRLQTRQSPGTAAQDLSL